MRVIMTGGGTGGHVYPAIAIADEIKRRYEDAEILFIGADDGMERTIVPNNGYRLEMISVDGLRRKRIHENFRVVKKLITASKRSKELIKEFGPDVVIGTGGYVSAPVVKAAQKLGVPTYIHEQNAFPGVTNKMLSGGVEKLFLGFEAASEHFKHKERHVAVGNPVRATFSISKQEARAALGIKEDAFMVLAFGGSQGAGRINKAMMDVIETFNGVEDFVICLGTGKYYYEAILGEIKDRNLELQDNIIVKEYIDEMNKYLAASDLVISRSGALTVAEVTVCGKPSIFIPSPHVTGNHQYHNAMAVARNGGAIVIEEDQLVDEKLSDEILKLKNNPEILNDMAEKSAACAPVHAAEMICDTIFGKMTE